MTIRFLLATVFPVLLAVTAQGQSKLVTFGDSITWGLGAKPEQAYARLLASRYGAVLENRAVSGQTACMMSNAQVFSKPLPSIASGSQFSTLMIGTNDSNGEGAGAYESIFEMCLRASLTWLTAAERTEAVRCARTPTWKDDGFGGLVSTDARDTMTCTLATTGGPLLVWFEANDASNASISVSLDGGTPRTFTTKTKVPIKMKNGRGSRGGAVVWFDAVPAGQHEVRIENAGGIGATGPLRVYGIGTTGDTAKVPRLFVAGVPFQRHDRKAAHSLAYDVKVKAMVATLVSRGFPLQFVDTRVHLTPDAAQFVDDVHPGALGQESLERAFATSIGPR